MNIEMRNHRMRIVGAVLLAGLTLGATTGYAQSTAIRLDPNRVVFPAVESSATIRVVRDGVPVPQRDITRVTVEPAYARMFEVIRPAEEPGVIIIRTVPAQIEVGSYYIEVEAAGQQTRGQLVATLDTHRSILEEEAQMMGETIEEARMRYGLSRYMPEEQLSIALPERYAVGTYLELRVPRHENRRYVWYVNDEPVLTGEGEHVLRHPLSESGPITVRLDVHDGALLVAQWRGETTAVAESPIPYGVPRNATVLLDGPTGFQRYEWRINGERVSQESRLRHTFSEFGSYRVECLALEPENDSRRAFRRVVWEVEVTE